MPPLTDPESAAAPSGRRPREQARLLRSALAAERLPLGALRLTILQALDAGLRRRGRPPRERALHRDRVGRFLADHADRRRVPSRREVRRWVRELERRGRADAGEAEATLRSVELLYAIVLGRGPGERPESLDGPSRRRPAVSSGPVTGRRPRDRPARQ